MGTWAALIGRGGLMSGRKHAELGSLRPCDLDLGQARPSYRRAGGLRGVARFGTSATQRAVTFSKCKH